jgi:hypothetical protein
MGKGIEATLSEDYKKLVFENETIKKEFTQVQGAAQQLHQQLMYSEGRFRSLSRLMAGIVMTNGGTITVAHKTMVDMADPTAVYRSESEDKTGYVYSLTEPQQQPTGVSEEGDDSERPEGTSGLSLVPTEPAPGDGPKVLH